MAVVDCAAAWAAFTASLPTDNRLATLVTDSPASIIC